jgi:hypothetical protein
MRNDYVTRNVRNVPMTVKRAIFHEARAREIAMSDVIGQILSTHWQTPYEPIGEPTQEKEARGDQLIFRIPPLLDLRIKEAARAQKITESSAVLQTLAAHYGLVYEPVRRRGRVMKIAEDAA